MLMLPWPLLSPRAALALVFAQAGSSIGAVVVEGLVAVHAFSPHNLPIDEGGYEVIPHLRPKPFIRPCCAEQLARDAASALLVQLIHCSHCQPHLPCLGIKKDYL